MTIYDGIDNDIDSLVEDGDSTAEEGFFFRASDLVKAWRFTSKDGESTYGLVQNLGISMAASSSVKVGVYFRIEGVDFDNVTRILSVFNDSNNEIGGFSIDASDLAGAYWVDDDAASGTTNSIVTISRNQWYFGEVEYQRASASGVSDGLVSIYLNGALLATKTAVKNFTRSAIFDEVRFGVPSASADISTSFVIASYMVVGSDYKRNTNSLLRTIGRTGDGGRRGRYA